MVHRLSVILKKCSNKKFRNGFVKYLTSLDFVEFNALFIYYINVIGLMLHKYNKNKIRFFSIKWFKKKIVDYKYNQLYYIFSDANFAFITIINENMKHENVRSQIILDEIDDIKNSIENLYNKELVINLPLSKEDVIELSVLIIDNIYLRDELKKLVDEIKRTK